MRIHGPVNFSFAYGHTGVAAIHAEPGVVGQVDAPGPGLGAEGPREDDLAFLAADLEAAEEPHRVVLMHMPPYLDGHYAPHADWGFEQREAQFLSLLRKHGVTLVLCAHGLAFDTHVHEGIRFVMPAAAVPASAPTTAASVPPARPVPRIAARSTTPSS